jgi:hypothetical protein
VRIGAILTVAGGRQGEKPHAKSAERKGSAAALNGSSCVLLDVLGQSVLGRTIAKLKQIGTLPPHVISEGASSVRALPSRSTRSSIFTSAWETTVSHYVQQGVELLFLVRLSGYTDVDYRELLQFHLDTESPFTQVYGPEGSLDIALVDATRLRDADGNYRSALSTFLSQQRRFAYRGYSNALRSPHDFHKLVQDGLYGRCGLRPVGTGIQDGVWIGQGAQVDRGATITAPAFIGSGSRVGESCVITGASAIERDCEIDYGTIIDQSCILQDTYVGMALEVRRAVLSQEKLFHLDRNIELSIADHRLMGSSAKSLPFLSGLGSFFWGESQRAT